MLNANTELKKWAPVLEHADAPAITDSYKKAVTAKLLENTEVALKEQHGQEAFDLNEATLTGSSAKFDPVLISLVRRAMPNLIAYDVAGVQPMSGPTGLIFAMKAKVGNVGSSPTGGTPAAGAFSTEADTDLSGAGTHDATQGIGATASGTTRTAVGIATASAEAAAPAEMGFTIEKQTVTANTRQLRAEYSMELAQDLKAVHGLDAESELANILSAEILAEINREMIRSISFTAKTGTPAGDVASGGAAGTFRMNADADGRWAQERLQSLIFQVEKEANRIGTDTLRGKGNFVICSANVASGLAAGGNMKFGGEELAVDATGNTFAGTLNGKLKVYIDPYAAGDYFTVGYKGANAYDAGIFYCPYVPLTMVRAVDGTTFQPKIAFKTRYGIVANPFAGNAPSDSNITAQDNDSIAYGLQLPEQNPYYRYTEVSGLGVKA